MIKTHVMHTGTVYVSPALPFKDTEKNPNPFQLSLLPKGTALDEAQALNSLRWIAKISRSPECVESLANHDTGVVPHEIII